MRESVVVTGASGFIGRAVVRRLRQKSLNVVAVSRRAVPEAVRVRTYMDTPSGDVLVHLAETSNRAEANRGGSSYCDECLTVIHALQAKGYSRVVYASSASLFGDHDARPHCVEDDVRPFDAYTHAKWDVERAVLAAAGGVVARLSNIYGFGMDPSNVMSVILGQIPGRGPLMVADTSPVRDFLWVEDAAVALAAMAEGRAGGVFNIGTAVGTSIGDLARLALELSGEDSRMVIASAPAGHASHLVVDIDRTTATFGWRPACTLRQGVGRLLATRQANA